MKKIDFKIFKKGHSIFLIILCLFLVLSFSVKCQADSKAELEAQLKDIERQIELYEEKLKESSQDKDALKRELDKLRNEADTLTNQVYNTKGNLNVIGKKINTTVNEIDNTLTELQKTKQETAALIRALYQMDQTSFLEMLLSSNKFSDFFLEMNSLNALHNRINANMEELEGLHVNLVDQKQTLEEQKEENSKLLQIQELQRLQAEEAKQKQQEIFSKKAGEVLSYQKTIEQKEAEAAAIKSRIYDVAGIKKGSVTFGEAYEIAKIVTAKVNISPAFLLAIITQESNLGANVGTCNRPGDPTYKHYDKIMKPTRDLEPFVKIVTALGRDPNTTPVSCPMYRDGKQIGYGGAMGPAQFIPSTWIAYEDDVKKITGKSVVDP
jgi:peptidoglycan hydrolase CwlO-like protein